VQPEEYTLSEASSGVNGAHLMAAQGAFGTDFYDRSILRPKHRAYYRSGRSVIKIGPKGAPSLGQSIKGKLKTENYWPFMNLKIIGLSALREGFIDLRTSPSLGGAQSFFGE